MPLTDTFYHGASSLLHFWGDSSLPHPRLTFSMPKLQMDKNVRQLFARYPAFIIIPQGHVMPLLGCGCRTLPLSHGLYPLHKSKLSTGEFQTSCLECSKALQSSQLSWTPCSAWGKTEPGGFFSRAIHNGTKRSKSIISHVVQLEQYLNFPPP